MEKLKEDNLRGGNLSDRDILQLRAFHASYRLLHDLPKTERFITAICQTCDDMYDKADKAKIAEWKIKYLREAKIAG